LGLVVAYLFLSERDLQTLGRLLVSGIAFAVANQVGNAGSDLLAVLMIAAGVGYAVLTVWAKLDRRA
jgi:hypothetical protein